MSAPALIVSPEELEAIVRKVVREELSATAPAPAKALTEDDVAKARKSLRRFGRGK